MTYLRLLLVLTLLGMTGCSSCGDGNTSGNTPPAGTADMSTADMPAVLADMSTAPADMSRDLDTCAPESDEELCANNFAQCDTISTVDSCGITRTIACGTCSGDEQVCQDNRCLCETEAQFCARQGAVCGSITGFDTCGNGISANCGMCEASESCTVNNQCICQRETDQGFCQRRQARCGEVTGFDNCGEARKISCGECTNGTCSPNKQCSCEAETDDQLCARVQVTCGQIQELDNCGTLREINCGSCAGAEVCSASGMCGCEPESDELFCGRFGKQCGAHEAPDNCGDLRSVANCGTCALGVCEESGVCSVCQPESNPQFCARQGASCGELVAADNCNVARTVMCGGCAQGLSCADNSCSCTPETDAQLCTRKGATCGALSARDNCGTTRTVPSCGMCTGANTSCQNNSCECLPESDSEFCAAKGAVCGEVFGTDRCGNPRNTNCGACASGQQCNASNTCQCQPEYDNQLCGRLGKQCGSLTASDNCGVTRTVQSCGSCTQGSCLPDNTCSTCQPESNIQFCARLGKQCGTVTAADNCGTQRSVANCGSCQSGEMCQANQCACVPETDAQLCGLQGAECGAITTTDRCNVSRTVACGTCTAGSCEADNTCSSPSCTPDPTLIICAQNSWDCGDHDVVDNCGVARTISCGGCSGFNTCVSDTTNPSASVCELLFHEDTNGSYGYYNVFGHAVDLHDDFAIIGAPGQEGLAGSGFGFAGTAIKLTKNQLSRWGSPQAITPPNQGSSDSGAYFGYDVAVAVDHLIIGNPNNPDDEGVIEPIGMPDMGPTPSGASGGKTHYYQASNGMLHEIAQHQPGQSEGYSVALTEDGARANSVAGAPFDSTSASSYAIARYWVAASLWTNVLEQSFMTTASAFMGEDVAMEETTMVISAPGSDKVHVFTRATTTDQWSATAHIISPPAANGSLRFGTTVALSDDGQTLAITESRRLPFSKSVMGLEDTAVHIYQRNAAGNTWSKVMTYTNVGAGDPLAFGQSLALVTSSGVTRLIIGDPSCNNNNKGCIRIYKRTGMAWESNGAGQSYTPPNITPNAKFGWAMSAHKDALMVSAPFYENSSMGGGGYPTGRIYFLVIR